MNSRVLEVPSLDGPFQAPFVQGANYVEFVARNELCRAVRAMLLGSGFLAKCLHASAELEARIKQEIEAGLAPLLQEQTGEESCNNYLETCFLS